MTLTIDGKQRRKKAFIFMPNVSRYRFVYPIESETTASAIEACEAAWAFYGGVFRVLLPDNTKAIVTKASATSPHIAEAFIEYAQARGFTVAPARVRKPKDKARAERTVRYVRDDCFGGEVLASIKAARTRALFWSEHEAGVKPHGTTKRRPKEHFESEEQMHLLAAPGEPYDIPQWSSISVDKTQHVAAFGAMHMLPEHLAHHKLRARADSKLVRFYDANKRLVKVLPRVGRGERAFDAEDIPEHKRAYALRDGSFLADQARQHAQSIGQFADRILDSPAPWMKLRRVTALLGLVRRYGTKRLDVASRRALTADMTDVDRLRRMLEQPSAQADEAPPAKVIPIARYLRPQSTWAIDDRKDKTP